MYTETENYLRSKSQIILRGNVDGKEFKILPIDTNYFLFLEYEKGMSKPTFSAFFEKTELSLYMKDILPKVEASIHPDDLERFYKYRS